jgi:DNA-binding MltR family transcriptional regulator
MPALTTALAWAYALSAVVVYAVAGLLDGDGPLTGISALLNRLLTGLGL